MGSHSPESPLCPEGTGRLRGEGFGRTQRTLSGTTPCLGTFPSVFGRQHRLEDHVMMDGNALLQQHELVMNQLMNEQGHKSLFQPLSTALL